MADWLIWGLNCCQQFTHTHMRARAMW